MKSFSHLVRERAKAMGVFIQAKQRLEQVHKALFKEEVDAHNRAKTEADKIAWLKSEQVSVSLSLDKITDLLG